MVRCVGAVLAASSCEEAPLRRDIMEAGAAASGPDLRWYDAGKDGIVAVTDLPSVPFIPSPVHPLPIPRIR